MPQSWLGVTLSFNGRISSDVTQRPRYRINSLPRLAPAILDVRSDYTESRLVFVFRHLGLLITLAPLYIMGDDAGEG